MIALSYTIYANRGELHNPGLHLTPRAVLVGGDIPALEVRGTVGSGLDRAARQAVVATEKMSHWRVRIRYRPRRTVDTTARIDHISSTRGHFVWEPVGSSLEQIVETAWRWQLYGPRAASQSAATRFGIAKTRWWSLPLMGSDS